MKKIILTVFGAALLQSVTAQDLHFTQTTSTPLLINPAATGVYDGWERLTINHRNQWLGTSTQFMSTAVAADVNLGKSRTNDRAYAGLGVLFFNDVGGDSNFGLTQGALSVSGVIPMGRSGHIISAGLQTGIGQRSADINAVTFNSQWGGAGFDPTIISGEANSIPSFSYLDASAGLFYQFDGSRSSFARSNDLKVQFGLSGFHLNAPSLKYSNGLYGEKLNRKFVVHTRVTSEIVGSKWSFDASAARFIQGEQKETIIGLMMRYRFENGTKLTGLAHNAYLSFGSYFRWGDAICPSVAIDWRGFKFGASYDLTVSLLRQVYQGSLEFSLSYTNLHDALFKSKKRRF